MDEITQRDLITDDELWRLADQLQVSQASAQGLRTVHEVAEAFGVSPAIVREQLDSIRGESSQLAEIERLRRENEALQAQLRGRSGQAREPQRDWIDERHDSTAFQDGYIETVKYERTRSPAWAPAAAILVFLVIALAMFSMFSSQSAQMRDAMPGGLQRERLFDSNGKELPPLVQEALREQMRRSR